MSPYTQNNVTMYFKSGTLIRATLMIMEIMHIINAEDINKLLFR